MLLLKPTYPVVVVPLDGIFMLITTLSAKQTSLHEYIINHGGLCFDFNCYSLPYYESGTNTPVH
jgi:hypothetical protein